MESPFPAALECCYTNMSSSSQLQTTMHDVDDLVRLLLFPLEQYVYNLRSNKNLTALILHRAKSASGNMRILANNLPGTTDKLQDYACKAESAITETLHIVECIHSMLASSVSKITEPAHTFLTEVERIKKATFIRQLLQECTRTLVRVPPDTLTTCFFAGCDVCVDACAFLETTCKHDIWACHTCMREFLYHQSNKGTRSFVTCPLCRSEVRVQNVCFTGAIED